MSHLCPLLSPQDCPPEAGDFRAQQCSAHADVRFQGRYHEWLPVYNDPENPCALRCWAKASGLVLELAPKVLDGTRCYTESLDMCISGVCQVGLGRRIGSFLVLGSPSLWFQVVGCDHELGSTVQEDNCGVCGGDGTTCRLVRGQYRSQQSAGRSKNRPPGQNRPARPSRLTRVSVCSVQARTRWWSSPTRAATSAWF